jgi:tetrahydromethanopterin S-methyltransferase subunit F
MEFFVIFLLSVVLVCILCMIYLDTIRESMLKDQTNFSDRDFDDVRRLFWGMVISLVSSLVIVFVLLI